MAAAERKAAATRTSADYLITTNGTLLTRDIADFMNRYLFTVFFSIDGDEERHDELRKYIRGAGSYRDVERNLQYLHTRPGVHLIGSSVIRNGLRLADALELLETHGAHQCKAERVRLMDDDALTLAGEQHRRRYRRPRRPLYRTFNACRETDGFSSFLEDSSNPNADPSRVFLPCR